jgi:hypothetical protein
VHAGFAVAFEESDEIGAADIFDEHWLDGFGGYFVWTTSDGCAKAKDITRTGDLQDEGLTLRRRAEELDLPLAEHGDVVARVLFLKKDGASGKAPLHTNRVKVLKFLWREIAEHA